MANLRCMSLKGTSLVVIAATALFAISAAAQSVTDKCGLAHVIRSQAPSPERKLSPILPWPIRLPPVEWSSFSIASRTFISNRCSAPALRPPRLVSGTFI